MKDIGTLVHEDISCLPDISSSSTAHCMNQHGLDVGCIFMEEELTSELVQLLRSPRMRRRLNQGRARHSLGWGTTDV